MGSVAGWHSVRPKSLLMACSEFQLLTHSSQLDPAWWRLDGQASAEQEQLNVSHRDILQISLHWHQAANFQNDVAL